MILIWESVPNAAHPAGPTIRGDANDDSSGDEMPVLESAEEVAKGVNGSVTEKEKDGKGKKKGKKEKRDRKSKK